MRSRVTAGDTFSPETISHARKMRGGPDRRPPNLLETSLTGVFAVGDVRHASFKRVASAVGEGSIAIRMVHGYLAEHVGRRSPLSCLA
jgi:thioredoxin reductase (NADPH)